MTKCRKFSLVDIVSYFFYCSTIKDRCCKFHPEFQTSPSKNSFIDLSKVHPAWYAQWIQYDIHRCSIFQEWHVFRTNNLRNNTLVTVTTCHLISHFKLTLNRDINLREF